MRKPFTSNARRDPMATASGIDSAAAPAIVEPAREDAAAKLLYRKRRRSSVTNA